MVHPSQFHMTQILPKERYMHAFLRNLVSLNDKSTIDSLPELMVPTDN